MLRNKYIKLKLLKNFLGIFLISTLIPIQSITASEEKKITLDKTYLESRKELKDYILDTGDILFINFIHAPELSQSVPIDAQGEIYLERIGETFVRGLTINELEKLMEESYEKFLIKPEIKIRLQSFKPIRISITGEVRNPGMIKFDAFNSSNSYFLPTNTNLNETNNQGGNSNNTIFPTLSNNQLKESSENLSNNVKKRSDFVSTISNAINRAGGLTSYSDITKIELVRDIPIGNGGGKKKAIINFTPYLDGSSTNVDLRLFDGDSIYIPRLKVRNNSIIRDSILKDLTPRFINVFITGSIENPGRVQIPVEGTLSDVLNISGPRKPLSGKVFLIRYGRDGSLIRKNIKFSSTSSPGTKSNPSLLEGDIVSVQKSLFGKSTDVIREVTQPFIGIYTTKELIQNF